MTRLKIQPMPPPAYSKLLRKIVTVLFPHQPECDFIFEDSEKEMIPPITEEQLMEACGRVKNTKAPGLDGIPENSCQCNARNISGRIQHVPPGGYLPGKVETSASPQGEETVGRTFILSAILHAKYSW